MVPRSFMGRGYCQGRVTGRATLPISTLPVSYSPNVSLRRLALSLIWWGGRRATSSVPDLRE